MQIHTWMCAHIYTYVIPIFFLISEISADEVEATWCRGRHFSQQDPECLSRTMSSKAEHSALRGWASSQNISEETKFGSTSSSVLMLNGSSELILLKIRSSVCPSSLHPTSPVCRESSCTSSQSSQSPPVSSSHFLGKSEPLPAIQQRTEHFKDGWTLTQTQTHL